MNTETYVRRHASNPEAFGPSQSAVSGLMSDIGILDFDFPVKETKEIGQRWARYSQELDWSRRHEEVVRQLDMHARPEHVTSWYWETSRSPLYVLQLDQPASFTVNDLQKLVGAVGILAKLAGKWFRETFVELAELEAESEFIHREEIREFLSNSPRIIPYLRDGIETLRKHFGQTCVVQIAASVDPDDGHKALFANVLTGDSATNALATLREFDNTWYSQLPIEVRQALNFDVVLV